MDKLFIKIFLVIVTCSSGTFLGVVKPSPPYWGAKIYSTSATPCGSNNQKLLLLLNLLCNATQVTSITTRDACYGCFFRAGALPSGPTQLQSLSQCATIYLANTSYNACAIGLSNIVRGIQQLPQQNNFCYTGYCEFVRCVRRLNTNNLIDSCFTQNMINKNLANTNDRVALYINTTSCILARTRCNQYNPITGELQQTFSALQQQQYAPQYFGKTYYSFNSLQITSMGDLRVISFPSTVAVADVFCSVRSNLDQSNYIDAAC